MLPYDHLLPRMYLTVLSYKEALPILYRVFLSQCRTILKILCWAMHPRFKVRSGPLENELRCTLFPVPELQHFGNIGQKRDSKKSAK
jgi:hypothetical protein